ncbi:TPM domain-containing protein [Blattabacterium sp. DPU]|uniref:TPM domain-containing protein n=1 Tax=Blattabacterium sp. DPU TaxID=2715232 RepID=UPI00140C0335|nr:TPM domain-containing protein [Blattabacterium sp. DPU]QIK16796.1 TPM domain-containing protein [Blattabacterium sp. DPU]
MKKIIQSILIILIFFCSNLIQGQFNIPEAPKKIYPIQDYVGVLSKKQIKELNQKLISYSEVTSTEILVSIIQDLHGEDPNLLASKWGEKWKIGKIHKNNGIIILLSIHDKKISIQNGYGIEPYITDFLTIKIIKKIKPILKNNLYYQAIDCGTKEIFKILKNKFQKKQNNRISERYKVFIIIGIFLMIFFLFYFFYMNKTTDSSLLMTLFLTNFLFRDKNLYHDHDDNFDGFGEGGNFGGGGSSSEW